MSRYFYTVAALSYLAYETDSFMTSDEFLAACKAQLSGPDFAAVQAASLVPPQGEGRSETERQFYRFERGLRNALVRLRAGRLGLDASEFVSTTLAGSDYSEDIAPAELARAAFTAQTPLQGEEILDRGRWDALTDIEALHFFDLDVLVAYHLKLQILARRKARNRDNGIRGYEKLYSEMTALVDLSKYND